MVAVALVVAMAADWSAVAAKVNPSIVYIESTGGSCTGFLIDADAKGDKDRILTAAHCEGERLFADNVPAKVLFLDKKRDLMVLEVEDTGRPALTLAKANPQTGDEIASYGYGYSLERPMFRTAHVSDAAAILPDVEGGPFIMIDAGFVSGQSGGPCINASGEVVSIVQRASGLVGIGIGTEAITGKIRRFLPKPKP